MQAGQLASTLVALQGGSQMDLGAANWHDSQHRELAMATRH